MRKLQVNYRQGREVFYQNLHLSYDEYYEVAPGVFDRLLRPTDPLIPAYVHDIHLGRLETMIHVKAAKGCKMPAHYHRESERIIAIKGSFKETVSGLVYRPGVVLELEPYQSHGVEILEDCEQVILIYPRIH